MNNTSDSRAVGFENKWDRIKLWTPETIYLAVFLGKMRFRPIWQSTENDKDYDLPRVSSIISVLLAWGDLASVDRSCRNSRSLLKTLPVYWSLTDHSSSWSTATSQLSCLARGNSARMLWRLVNAKYFQCLKLWGEFTPTNMQCYHSQRQCTVEIVRVTNNGNTTNRK